MVVALPTKSVCHFEMFARVHLHLSPNHFSNPSTPPKNLLGLFWCFSFLIRQLQASAQISSALSDDICESLCFVADQEKIL